MHYITFKKYIHSTKDRFIRENLLIFFFFRTWNSALLYYYIVSNAFLLMVNVCREKNFQNIFTQLFPNKNFVAYFCNSCNTSQILLFGKIIKDYYLESDVKILRWHFVLRRQTFKRNDNINVVILYLCCLIILITLLLRFL